jgi:ketosteroid isomerase-like protein
LIRRYFAACNAADYDALMARFTPDAVPLSPGYGHSWRGADAIAQMDLVRRTPGSQWTIEKILVSRDGRSRHRMDALEAQVENRAAR